MSPLSRRIAESAVRAAERIGSTVAKTPLVRSEALSRATGGEVWVKLENEQRTGSFKLRGAANRLLALTAAERSRGCVTASSGNHGAAVALAMRELGIHGVIFVPERTPAKKISAIRELGGELATFGVDGVDTELHAREFAESRGMTYVSPYNDFEVIAGQATCGIEIAEQLPDLDSVFVAVGGGGLIAGVGSVLRQARPGVRIVGCQPRASAVMALSIAAGRLLEVPSEPTLSDGTAGGIEPGAITFDLCRELVDEFILVSESEIEEAMRWYMRHHDGVIEGAAGVAVAALLSRTDLARGRRTVLLVCGGNVDPAVLDRISRGVDSD